MIIHARDLQRLLNVLGNAEEGQAIIFDGENWIIGDMPEGGSPDASEATEGQVWTADGEGGAGFQDPPSEGERYTLAADVTNTDDTATPVNLTGMVFDISGFEKLTTKGTLLFTDAAEFNAACIGFNVPAGCVFIGHTMQPNEQSVNTWGSSHNPTTAANAGETCPENSSGSELFPVDFTLSFLNAGTSGTVQMYFVNRSGDEVLQGVLAGTTMIVTRH